MEMWRIAAQIYYTCRCTCNKMVTRYLAQKQFRDIRDKLDLIRKLSNSDSDRRNLKLKMFMLWPQNRVWCHTNTVDIHQLQRVQLSSWELALAVIIGVAGGFDSGQLAILGLLQILAFSRLIK